MNIIKKAAAGMCAAVMLTSFVSCAEDSVVESQEQQIEISFSWWGNDARNKYTLEAVEKFEELHPDIKVSCNYSEWSGFEMRNQVWMNSNTESDVMQINYGWLDTYSADGEGYYDLGALNSTLNLSYISDKSLSYGYRNGKLNAVPIAMNAETVYINKTIFDKYGLDIPKTWDDFFNAAKVMSKDGIYPLSAAKKSMWLYLETYAEQKSGKTFLNARRKLNFGKEEFAEMLTFYKKLVDEGVLPPVERYERLRLDNEEYAGSVAWVSDANNYFGAAIENGRDIQVAPYTAMAGSETGTGWYVKPATMYAISKHTAHPEEAAMLLNFLLNSEEMALLQGVEKGIPLSSAARDYIKSANMLEGLQYTAYQEMDKYILPQLPTILENSSLIDVFFSYAKAVVFDGADIDESADALYAEIGEFFS